MTSLLSLPDETLVIIGELILEEAECQRCEHHVVPTFKSYASMSKRIYSATQRIAYKGWELVSESHERLLQHKDHLSIVRSVRSLTLPWCDTRCLSTPGPSQHADIANQTGGTDQAAHPTIDGNDGDDDVQADEQYTSNTPTASYSPLTDRRETFSSRFARDRRTMAEKARAYDHALAECISLFERLEDLSISFADWRPPCSGPGEDPAAILSRARLHPFCETAISATVSSHLSTITSLAFSGIRSSLDHQRILKALSLVNPNLRKLSLVYRFDLLLLSLDQVDPDLDSSVVDGRELWEKIGQLEHLKKLVIVYMPAQGPSPDSDWAPTEFKPNLTTICLEEAALSSGIASGIFRNHLNIRSITAGRHLLHQLKSFQPPTNEALTFPKLKDLDLSLSKSESCLDALALFAKAPLEQLALTTPSIAEFLQAYPTDKSRQKTVKSVFLYEIYPSEQDKMSEERKEEWIRKYQAELDISLSIT